MSGFGNLLRLSEPQSLQALLGPKVSDYCVGVTVPQPVIGFQHRNHVRMASALHLLQQ